MTDAQELPDPPRRRRWTLFAPTVLLLAGAGVWTGFWFFAADKANEAIDVWLAREASRGRVYACQKRDLGGFPFRIELACEGASAQLPGESAQLPGESGAAFARAPRFNAVAQVYDPKRVIGELFGPVEITGADGARATVSFASARASLRVEGRRFERGSVVVATPRLIVGADEIGAAKEIQLHARRKPGAPDRSYEVAASLTEGVSPLIDVLPVGQGPVTAELQAEAAGVDDLRPGPVSERLRAFAEAGGQLTVTRARIARGDVAAEGRGDARLDLRGRLDGAFDITARGVDRLIGDLVGGGRKDALSSLLGAGASLLGAPAELDGQAARAYRVKLDEGRVLVGPIRVTRVPPLF